MVDFRIYRAAFIPAVAAAIVLLFSLEGVPSALTPLGTPIAFDQDAAVQTARDIVHRYPNRPPGSAADADLARMVANRLAAIRAGQLSEQDFSASWNGNDVQLHNVILTLPGDSSRVVAVVAARDSATVPGAASSASATGALLELAQDLASSTHSKTLVFASTDGGLAGAAGARELAAKLRGIGPVDAAIVISQPGSASPEQPFVVTSSAGDESTSSQLVHTAEHAYAEQAPARTSSSGALAQLARLAMPSGLGEQGALIDEGIPAVALSSAGELPLPASRDQLDDLSADTLGVTGRAALATVLALDGSTASPTHGPSAYISLGSSLVPGWSLAVLALALLLPALVAAVDGTARAARQGLAPARTVHWAAILGLPPLALVVCVYVLALAGIFPRPRFPFDPAAYGVGPMEVIALLFLTGVVVAGYWRIRAWQPPRGVRRPAAAPATGVVAAIGVAVVWLGNPYLALLLVPAAHAWLVGLRAGRAATALVAVGALVPVAIAGIYVYGQLDLGAAGPWRLVLMLGDWQISPLAAVGACALCGSVLALITAGGATLERERVTTLDTSPIETTPANDDEQAGGSAPDGAT